MSSTYTTLVIVELNTNGYSHHHNLIYKCGSQFYGLEMTSIKGTCDVKSGYPILLKCTHVLLAKNVPLHGYSRLDLEHVCILFVTI